MPNIVICLIGPTAAGKTDLALALTKYFPCEIISVDSAMVYRGMNIGTAKPNQQILTDIPHHLIDICDPTEPYSVGKFCQDALQAIAAIQSCNKIPLLVGGTMLYFRALQQGLSQLPVADKQCREQINQTAAQQGWPTLHKTLATVDPMTAQRLHPNDAQRIQRALEVYYLTGIPLGKWHAQQQGFLNNYQIINIGLIPDDRARLKQKIAERFTLMLSQGFIDEVKILYERGDVHEALPAIRAVGYSQAWQYLSGKINQDEMTTRAITGTQQLAKRQLTWLRSWPNLHIFNSDDEKLFIYLARFLRLQIEEYQKA